MTIRRHLISTYKLPNNHGQSLVLVRVKRCVLQEVS